MTSIATVPSRVQSPELPDFLVPRMEHFYRERVIKDCEGGNVLIGAESRPGDLVLKTNDYLALGDHPEVVQAQVEALQVFGNSQMMSAVFLSQDNPQWDFQEAMAKFMRTESTLVSQSGYLANVGLIQAITAPSTPVYVDMLAHASLWHGVQAASAKLRPFRHNDVEHLERQIKKNGAGIVIVDSVYSTNGSVAPIREILETAEKHGCALIVDESHSLGTHGPAGSGMVVDLGLEDRVHFRTASLAKAFCGRGGIVACSARVSEFLTYSSLPNIFSSAILPHEFAAFSKTLEIIRREQWRRRELHWKAAWLRGRLTALGYNLNNSASQIISLEAGTDRQTIKLRDALESRGVFGAPFTAPATPKNRSCIRLSIHCTLTPDELQRIVSVCASIRTEVGMPDWASSKRLARAQARIPMSVAA